MKIAIALATALLWLGCSQFDVPQDVAPHDPSGKTGGGSEAGTAPADDSAAGALSQLPDACELFTAIEAAHVFKSPAERYEPRVECAYLEQGVPKMKSRHISAAVYCPALQDRRYDGLSQEQLVERLRIDMMGGEFQSVDPSIGRGAYIFQQPTGSIVFVPTGIQYRDPRGLGGEVAIQTTAMNFGDDGAGIGAAVAAARMVMAKLTAAQ
jgi:hypothetical protein